jgi:hypothetical protein
MGQSHEWLAVTGPDLFGINDRLDVALRSDPGPDHHLETATAIGSWLGQVTSHS